VLADEKTTLSALPPCFEKWTQKIWWFMEYYWPEKGISL